MTPNSLHAVEVKNTLDKLIHSVSDQVFDILESTYHESMRIYMMAGNDVLHQMNKVAFKNHIAESIKSTDAPSVWANYHLVEADEKNGHVIISRKVNLTGIEQVVTLSIDFIYEDNRWQITREVIFT